MRGYREKKDRREGREKRRGEENLRENGQDGEIIERESKKEIS